MNWRPVIGSVVNAEMWTFLCLNIICLNCMRKGRLYANKDNPAYLITTFNLLSETCQLLVHVIYVGPSIFLGDWLFEGQDSLGVTIASTWFLGFWYLGSFIQVLMAANRMCVVFLPGRKILTHRRIYIIGGGMFLAALGCVIYSQLLSPCCRITPDQRYYAYSYLVFENMTENPSMKYIDLPIDFATSIICATSYCALFCYVYRMEKGEQGRTKREIRLCVQFLIMFLAYTVTWSTFFLFPMLGIKIPEPYVTTTVVFMANCGVNAVIYLTMNKEVKFELHKLVGRVSPSAVYHSTTRPQQCPSQSQADSNPDSHIIPPMFSE